MIQQACTLCQAPIHVMLYDFWRQHSVCDYQMQSRLRAIPELCVWQATTEQANGCTHPPTTKDPESLAVDATAAFLFAEHMYLVLLAAVSLTVFHIKGALQSKQGSLSCTCIWCEHIHTWYVWCVCACPQLHLVIRQEGACNRSRCCTSAWQNKMMNHLHCQFPQP